MSRLPTSGAPFDRSYNLRPVTFQALSSQRLLSPFEQQQQDLQLSGLRQQQDFRQQLMGQIGNLLGGIGGGAGGDMGNPFQAGIEKIAASREAAIGQGFEDQLNTSLARLQDRGLGGSSFSLTAAQGNEQRKQQALNDLSGDIGGLEIQGAEAALSLEDRRRQQQMQLLTQLLGQVF